MNMVGQLNISFYLTDTDEEEMNQIIDEIAEEAEIILQDYEIGSEWDIEMTQDIKQVKNKYSNFIEEEKEGGSLIQTAKEAYSYLMSKVKRA